MLLVVNGGISKIKTFLSCYFLIKSFVSKSTSEYPVCLYKVESFVTVFGPRSLRRCEFLSQALHIFIFLCRSCKCPVYFYIRDNKSSCYIFSKGYSLYFFLIFCSFIVVWSFGVLESWIKFFWVRDFGWWGLRPVVWGLLVLWG